MRVDLFRSIIPNPQPIDAGTITVNAVVFGYNSPFTASSFFEEFIDEENDECPCKQDLNYFLMESGINDDNTTDAMIKLFLYVSDVTSSASFTNSPGCALQVLLRVLPSSHIEEAVSVSFDDTNYFRFRPASKLVVKALTRNIYDKISSTGEKCTICLEEFSKGGTVVTLPCQHNFDEDCAVKWFETSHFCPLCRLELPCEDQ